MSTGSSATEHFVEKWYGRVPEMRIAAVFCARADAAAANKTDAAQARLRFETWGALQNELRETLFELSDAGVASAKRGWWAEELQLVAQGKPRHPLGEALATLSESKGAPWTGLSLALLTGLDESPPADTSAAITALQPIARAMVAVENAIFQAGDDQPAAARGLAVHWLLQRVSHGLGEEDGAFVPMHLLARHGLTHSELRNAPDPLLRDWGSDLLAALPASGSSDGAYVARARARFDAARLRRLIRRPGGHGGYFESHPNAISTLWRAWRAARGR
jgi:hypothetical protein